MPSSTIYGKDSKCSSSHGRENQSNTSIAFCIAFVAGWKRSSPNAKTFLMQPFRSGRTHFELCVLLQWLPKAVSNQETHGTVVHITSHIPTSSRLIWQFFQSYTHKYGQAVMNFKLECWSEEHRLALHYSYSQQREAYNNFMNHF